MRKREAKNFPRILAPFLSDTNEMPIKIRSKHDVLTLYDFQQFFRAVVLNEVPDWDGEKPNSGLG